jgi:hypothetical protein
MSNWIYKNKKFEKWKYLIKCISSGIEFDWSGVVSIFTCKKTSFSMW